MTIPMFGALGDVASLMKQAKEMQGKMGEIQDRLALMRIRGSAGGGMISVEVNGKQDVISCQIDPVLMEGDDREMVEELFVSAMNDALARSREVAADSMKEAAGGLNIPGLEAAMSQLGLGPGK
jgi:DNA-binding YbaB/EbfC family protein